MESVGRRAAVIFVLVLAVCAVPLRFGIVAAEGATASYGTTVALAVTPPSWIPGTTSVSLVASMTPATVGGTVSFYDGTTLLGVLPHRAIRAFLGQVELSPGRHALSATFRPDSASFERSTTSVVYRLGEQTSSQPTITEYQSSAAAEDAGKGKRRKAPPGAGGLRVRVPHTRVLGARVTRTTNNHGLLSGTGAPLLTLTMVGVVGVVAGIVVRSGARRRRRVGSPRMR